MTRPGLVTPDVLVLGAGGILGEAWMSALFAGLDEHPGFSARACPSLIGTSAGSIVAAALVAGVAPSARLGTLPQQPTGPRALRSSSRAQPNSNLAPGFAGATAGKAATIAGPLASIALRSAAPADPLARRAGLSRVPAGRRSMTGFRRAIDEIGAHWDGRLRVAAVDVMTGGRVMFGAADAPNASVADAVLASCSIPGVFRPITIAGRSYVDGGVWSLTNLDAADVSPGTRVLCLNPTGSLSIQFGLLGTVGPFSRTAAGVEAVTLRTRGAHVRTIAPDRDSVAAMGGDLMDPAPRADVIQAGLAQGRRTADGLS